MLYVPKSSRWQNIYHSNLFHVLLTPQLEVINHTFMLHDPLDNVVDNSARAFRHEFSELMFQWIMSGDSEITNQMIELNPNAANFHTLYSFVPPGWSEEKPICTAYGPRLSAELPYVFRELRRNPESRRACIMMLTPDDHYVADAIHHKETKCEYLCTMGFTFFIRGGKLHMATTMRSNNYTTTVCQDVYVFTRIQAYVAKEMQLSIGNYYHSTVSAHILPHEIERAADILKTHIWQDSANTEEREENLHNLKHVLRLIQEQREKENGCES